MLYSSGPMAESPPAARNRHTITLRLLIFRGTTASSVHSSAAVVSCVTRWVKATEALLIRSMFGVLLCCRPVGAQPHRGGAAPDASAGQQVED